MKKKEDVFVEELKVQMEEVEELKVQMGEVEEYKVQQPGLVGI